MAESNRNSSYIQSGDAIRRSMTRNSHYSHVSTQSWVMTNQQNPPPPPPEDSEPLSSPVRTPRPLPDPLPSPVRSPRPLPDPQLQPLYHPQQVLRTSNADPLEDEEEEYMNIDPNFPGLETGHLTEGLGRGRPNPTSTSTVGVDSGGRTFVGGFVAGLRRLPRVVLKYRSFGDKRKYFRRATYGSGGTLSNGTDMTTGNTLPLYVSNPTTPVAGPSTSRYVEAMEMPVPVLAEEPAPVIVGPSLSQRRRHPSFRVTPPSEEVAGQELNPEHLPDTSELSRRVSGMHPRESNAVTVFHLPGQEEFVVEEPPLPFPVPMPNRRPESEHHQQQSPVVSVPAEDLPQTQSPVLALPSHTSDYLKMAASSSPRSPRTRSSLVSSEPSFSSELHPVKRFFIKLYHLPWIAPERVTDDYRPPGQGRNRRYSSGVKKPMSSWYRGKPGVVLSIKNGSGEVDLLSSGSGSRRASTNTASSPLASPALQTRHRSSDHRRPRHRENRRRTHDVEKPSRTHEHRPHHRRNTSSIADMQQQQNSSPLIPAMYPYAYPYPYPYPTFQSPPPQRVHSHSTPRGPRPHRSTTYPHGYAPYQPPQPPPPVFVMHSPAHTVSSGDASHAAQVMSPVFVPMSLVPGSFAHEPARTGTPPVSPRAGEAAATGEA